MVRHTTTEDGIIVASDDAEIIDGDDGEDDRVDPDDEGVEILPDGGSAEADTDDAPRDLLVALSVYGDVEKETVAVTVKDEPRAISGAIDKAHRHGYVVASSEDATEDARPVRRRLRFTKVERSDLWGATGNER